MIRTALALACLATPALAQEPRCAPRERVTTALMDKFGEAPIGAGLSAGAVVEWWGNPATGTWTILRSTADGQACVLGSGDSLELMAQGERA